MLAPEQEVGDVDDVVIWQIGFDICAVLRTYVRAPQQQKHRRFGFHPHEQYEGSGCTRDRPTSCDTIFICERVALNLFSRG